MSIPYYKFTVCGSRSFRDILVLCLPVNLTWDNLPVIPPWPVQSTHFFIVSGWNYTYKRRKKKQPNNNLPLFSHPVTRCAFPPLRNVLRSKASLQLSICWTLTTVWVHLELLACVVLDLQPTMSYPALQFPSLFVSLPSQYRSCQLWIYICCCFFLPVHKNAFDSLYINSYGTDDDVCRMNS